MLDITRRLLSAAEGAEPVVLASILEAGPASVTAGSRLLVEPDGSTLGSLGDPALDALIVEHAATAFAEHLNATFYVTEAGLSERTVHGATSIYIEVVESKPVFLVVGAGHVGKAIARIADFLDYHVAILDDREDFANSENIPEADEVICDDFEDALERYPINANTSIVLVTRGHKQDELSLRKCLGRGANYLGMIGSKRRSGTVIEHLTDEGFDPAELARVRTPIGLDIGAESPEEIAISVMAEVIMLRNGGAGGAMFHRPASLRA